MSSVEGTPTSVEVGAVVVETSAQKSAASKEWNQTLSHDAERKARAVKRSETFKEAQGNGSTGLTGRRTTTN